MSVETIEPKTCHSQNRVDDVVKDIKDLEKKYNIKLMAAAVFVDDSSFWYMNEDLTYKESVAHSTMLCRRAQDHWVNSGEISE